MKQTFLKPTYNFQKNFLSQKNCSQLIYKNFHPQKMLRSHLNTNTPKILPPKFTTIPNPHVFALISSNLPYTSKKYQHFNLSSLSQSQFQSFKKEFSKFLKSFIEHTSEDHDLILDFFIHTFQIHIHFKEELLFVILPFERYADQVKVLMQEDYNHMFIARKMKKLPDFFDFFLGYFQVYELVKTFIWDVLECFLRLDGFTYVLDRIYAMLEMLCDLDDELFVKVFKRIEKDTELDDDFYTLKIKCLNNKTGKLNNHLVNGVVITENNVENQSSNCNDNNIIKRENFNLKNTQITVDNTNKKTNKNVDLDTTENTIDLLNNKNEITENNTKRIKTNNTVKREFIKNNLNKVFLDFITKPFDEDFFSKCLYEFMSEDFLNSFDYHKIFTNINESKNNIHNNSKNSKNKVNKNKNANNSNELIKNNNVEKQKVAISNLMKVYKYKKFDFKSRIFSQFIFNLNTDSKNMINTQLLTFLLENFNNYKKEEIQFLFEAVKIDNKEINFSLFLDLFNDQEEILEFYIDNGICKERIIEFLHGNTKLIQKYLSKNAVVSNDGKENEFLLNINESNYELYKNIYRKEDLSVLFGNKKYKVIRNLFCDFIFESEIIEKHFEKIYTYIIAELKDNIDDEIFYKNISAFDNSFNNNMNHENGYGSNIHNIENNAEDINKSNTILANTHTKNNIILNKNILSFIKQSIILLSNRNLDIKITNFIINNYILHLLHLYSIEKNEKQKEILKLLINEGMMIENTRKKASRFIFGDFTLLIRDFFDFFMVLKDSSEIEYFDMCAINDCEEKIENLISTLNKNNDIRINNNENIIERNYDSIQKNNSEINNKLDIERLNVLLHFLLQKNINLLPYMENIMFYTNSATILALIRKYKNLLIPYLKYIIFNLNDNIKEELLKLENCEIIRESLNIKSEIEETLKVENKLDDKDYDIRKTDINNIQLTMINDKINIKQNNNILTQIDEFLSYYLKNIDANKRIAKLFLKNYNYLTNIQLISEFIIFCSKCRIDDRKMTEIFLHFQPEALDIFSITLKYVNSYFGRFVKKYITEYTVYIKSFNIEENTLNNDKHNYYTKIENCIRLYFSREKELQFIIETKNLAEVLFDTKRIVKTLFVLLNYLRDVEVVKKMNMKLLTEIKGGCLESIGHLELLYSNVKIYEECFAESVSWFGIFLEGKSAAIKNGIERLFEVISEKTEINPYEYF